MQNPFNDWVYKDKPQVDPDETVASAPPVAWGANDNAKGGDAESGNAAWVTPLVNSGNEPTSKDLQKREKALAKKETELKKKDEELRKLEAQLRTQSGQAIADMKNWPPFYPVIRHDIATDIPPDFQRTITAAWICLLVFAFASFYNWVAALVNLCSNGTKEGHLSGFFLALIYLGAGVPLAYVIWYRALYRSAMSDRALGFAWFFVAFFAHLVFCIWSAVGPNLLVSQWSHAGVLSTISAFDKRTSTGIVYLIGAAFWVITSLISLVVLKMVYSKFRGRDTSSLKQELVQTTVSSRFTGS